MAATSGTGLPRLSEVKAWDTRHLTAAAQFWEGTAIRWEDGFGEVVRQSYAPAGSAWEGAAATAAQERALADRSKVNVVATHLRTASAGARSGAAELSAAQQSVMSAVSRATAAGFEVGDDLSVTYEDDGTPRAAARRTQAESMARDIWQRAADLTALDRRVAKRITESSNEIQSLSFGPGMDGPKGAPPPPDGPRNAREVHDIVDPLPPGKQPHVRELPTSAQIRALYDYLTQQGVTAPPSSYPGPERLLEDGTRISLRETSSSGGTTIDIRYPDGSTQKVHLPEDGEQPQQTPAQEPGFWDTVGGIGIAILGGIAWVGKEAAHPFS
jgi:hypothetical protein